MDTPLVCQTQSNTDKRVYPHPGLAQRGLEVTVLYDLKLERERVRGKSIPVLMRPRAGPGIAIAQGNELRLDDHVVRRREYVSPHR